MCPLRKQLVFRPSLLSFCPQRVLIIIAAGSTSRWGEVAQAQMFQRHVLRDKIDISECLIIIIITIIVIIIAVYLFLLFGDRVPLCASDCPSASSVEAVWPPHSSL